MRCAWPALADTSCQHWDGCSKESHPIDASSTNCSTIPGSNHETDSTEGEDMSVGSG